MNATLKETAAKALAPYPDGLDYHRAESVITALGLDDLDAFAERVWCDSTFGDGTFGINRLRDALKANLCSANA